MSLINESQKFHPLHGDRLANHLPMALFALDRMGAEPDRMRHLYETYSTNMELNQPANSPSPIKAIDQYLSHSERYNDYLDFFDQQMGEKGVTATLKQALAVLLPGISASAFHAAIRLAYAVEANFSSEIVIALAYWASEYQSMTVSMETEDETVQKIIHRVNPDFVNFIFAPGIIVDRMVEADQILTNQKTVIQPRDITLESIARFCLESYRQHQNFTLLHTITGCHAFRILTPYVDDMENALRILWQGIVMAFMSTGLSFINAQSGIEPTTMTWQEILNAACRNDDVHVIKLVYSCWQESEVWKSDDYKQVAASVIHDT